MTEPYKLIEKEYSWDDFYALLQGDEQLIRIYQKYNDNYTSCRNYDWSERTIRFSEGFIEFYNGSEIDYKFHKEFNEKILYGYGSFYPVSRIFDKVETGEEEEYEGNDGMYYTRPIMKTLDTYKLVERVVKIYSVKKF